MSKGSGTFCEWNQSPLSTPGKANSMSFSMYGRCWRPMALSSGVRKTMILMRQFYSAAGAVSSGRGSAPAREDRGDDRADAEEARPDVERRRLEAHDLVLRQSALLDGLLLLDLLLLLLGLLRLLRRLLRLLELLLGPLGGLFRAVGRALRR